jgi:hypothetical protein
LENVEEMEKFLDIYYHPKLNQEDINHLNTSITQNEIEVTIVFQKRKVKDLMGFSAQFCQSFKEEIIPTLFKLFHEIECERILLTNSMKPALHRSQTG